MLRFYIVVQSSDKPELGEAPTVGEAANEVTGNESNIWSMKGMFVYVRAARPVE